MVKIVTLWRTDKENPKTFLRFLSVFTGIFFVMTVIILQVIRMGIYSSVDTSLTNAVASVDAYVNMAMTRNFYVNNTDTAVIIEAFPNKEKPKEKMMNVDALFYDENGNLFNTADAFSNFSNVALNVKHLGKIIEGDTVSPYGQLESYHAITVAVDNASYPQVKYATFLVSIKQIEESTKRSFTIIMTVMILFWFVSIGVSVYLAYWSRKPIVESYEKQKSFVENASHELRTPLAVLQNRLESLFRRPDSTVLENSENIASSLEEVRNMRLLTTNLLNLARRDDGLQLEITEISPTFFSDIFNNYQMIAEDAQKEFTSQNLVNRSIKSDKTLLKQLMTILFDNAVKYTSDDGKIHFEVRTTDKHFYITAMDDGFGIKDEDKKKVFDRFYRVDKARTRQKGGFGLGLSLAKQITDSLGGQITIKDNTPKGSIFEVKL
ncbi:sensor histidine kinase [Streptococcus hillyeri]|uniref:histidine kinase n=1 Tax=Streptococcus hillyeri TaxID=2282420 RepID=A0A3L9DTQ1_9STRE|nr:HAMP domain-containing sensor histidine kinase [Streptococcus hillyeri]RLY04826.1 sensor histidine kinase [Streptococcus hillyeri]